MGSVQQEIRRRPTCGAGRRLGRRVRRGVTALARTRGPVRRPSASGLPFDDAVTADVPELPGRPRSERTALDVVADGATTSVDAARRLWDGQSRSPLGGAASTSLRLAWIGVVSVGMAALLGFGPPRNLSALAVVIIALGLVIRPVLLLCLGDDTLYTPDEAPSASAAASPQPSRPVPPAADT